MTRCKVSRQASTNPKTLSFRAGARNLVYQNWRTADSSSLRLLGMTRCKVSRQASTTPNIVISSEARNLLLGKDDPTTNLAVGYNLRRRNPPIPCALTPAPHILKGCHPEWPSGREGPMHLNL